MPNYKCVAFPRAHAIRVVNTAKKKKKTPPQITKCLLGTGGGGRRPALIMVWKYEGNLFTGTTDMLLLLKIKMPCFITVRVNP